MKQGCGFYAPEKTAESREFRWTGKTAAMTVAARGDEVDIPLLASHSSLRENPVLVRVFPVDDFSRKERLLSELTIFRSEWKTYAFALSPSDAGAEITLLFRVNRTWNPRKVNGSSDPRNLRVAVGEPTDRNHGGSPA